MSKRRKTSLEMYDFNAKHQAKENVKKANQPISKAMDNQIDNEENPHDNK